MSLFHALSHPTVEVVHDMAIHPGGLAEAMDEMNAFLRGSPHTKLLKNGRRRKMKCS